MTLTVGSLFSGIGGLDLGLERAGMTVVWQAENDPYCSRVLAKHWPHVPNLGDVITIDWSSVPRVDLICGGYPCQPFSLAGRRMGEADPRHLWPHMLDAIRVLRPRYALLENVPGHLVLGFGRVLGDLAEIGYDCEWDCIPAVAVGALHRRDRVFVVAYPASDGRRKRMAGQRERQHDPLGWGEQPLGNGEDRHVADPTGQRPQDRPTETGGRPGPARRLEPQRLGSQVADTNSSGLEGPGLFRAAPQRSRDWATEPDVGRVAHGIPHRVDRLRALGNAVVPQVAENIGRLLLAHLEVPA